MSLNLLLASTIGLNLSFSEPIQTPKISSEKSEIVESIDISKHLKAQLQERNREDRKQLSNTPIVEKKAFTRYQNLDVSAGLINRALNTKNLLALWYFNPQNNNLLEQKITEPFLLERGIKEVISVGVSNFGGSGPNRIKNIKATLEKFDGQIIPQGETFSFNEILDDVSQEEGFVYAKVILSGENKWGLGGGICQVSTNVFRAALNAGLPMVERRNHSLAIPKYAPHGLDATVYIGKQDLKFTNDTPGDILMKFVIRENKLVTVFYGTKDQRQIKIKRTKKWEGEDGRLTTHWEQKINKKTSTTTQNFVSHYGPNLVKTD